jgi:hypothetical protein
MALNFDGRSNNPQTWFRSSLNRSTGNPTVALQNAFSLRWRLKFSVAVLGLPWGWSQQYVGNYQCGRCHFPDHCNCHQNRLWKLSNRIKYKSLQPQEAAVDRALTMVIYVTFRIACFLYLWAGIAQSVFRLTTGWTVRGSNPGGGEIFHTRPDRPWGLPNLLYNGYRVFPGSKAAGAWCWPPTPI